MGRLGIGGLSRRYKLRKVTLALVVMLIVFAPIALSRLMTETADGGHVHGLMILPFVLLLFSIALVPLMDARWWERYYPGVSLGLALIAVIYYVLVTGESGRMVRTANEYLSFMALIGSLYVVSGGIYVRIRGRSTPLVNTVLLALGAVMSNFLGTTGASMVLIRPFVRINRYRISGYHVVFFIFIVCNIGGMLTPIGDPPLFLGYLKGVPFLWVITHIWSIWLIATGPVLLVFYLIDRRNFRRLPAALGHEIAEKGEHPSVGGLGNLVFLAAILGAVFLPRPVREIVMLAAALASGLSTHREVHDRNAFDLAPLKEVAVLFAGIFATVTPVMDWVQMNAASLGITRTGQFYWGSGILSSVLDNAPTYLNFLSLACGLHGLSVDNPLHVKALLGLLPPQAAGNPISHVIHGALAPPGESWRYVLAISAASVMFGALTYIGNGPNLMVKSIAERSHVRMPSFFAYIIAYSIPVLIPVFVIIWLGFFF
ncbi:MAG: sodium:proton antiporter [Syntrophorhabdales bacterium]|jgi:Na+/H+ antiporter NhaD/arsenite permease-like protein